MYVMYRRWLTDPEGYWSEFIKKTMLDTVPSCLQATPLCSPRR
jgi:hypothetical protein